MALDPGMRAQAPKLSTAEIVAYLADIERATLHDLERHENRLRSIRRLELASDDAARTIEAALSKRRARLAVRRHA
jgi:hypothetical protein